MSLLNHNPQTTITWTNLYASVPSKQILSNCSGYAKPCQMIAIMGPSEAGKTTLLSLLAAKGANEYSRMGEVKANGISFNSREFYSFGSFVYQNDILFQSLTVRQSIQFTADLKLRGTQEYKNEKVDSLINQLQLYKCQNTKIGGKFLQGISGGERKRTCIAIELISNPAVLILDEPTSGLDSSTACLILKILQKICKSGKTIIFTIHQPSSRLYNMLDRLLLLHKGETIYQGKAKDITEYLSSLKIDVPTNYNVCDFFMMEISDYRQKQIQQESSLSSGHYENSLQVSVKSQIQLILKNKDEEGFAEKQPATGFFYQLLTLLRRNWINAVRHPMQLSNRFFNVIINFILIGCIFYKGAQLDFDTNLDPSTNLNVYLGNVQGLCFVSITTVIMGGIFSVALLFPIQRQVYVKQESSRTYTPSAYYISKLLIEIPLGIVFTLMYAASVYYMLALKAQFSNFIVFALITCCMHFTGNSLGIMLGCLFKDAQRTSALAPAFILPLMMFSGLYTRLSSIGAYIGWIQYISPFKYGLQGLLYNQFNDNNVVIEGIPFDIIKILDLNLTSIQNAAVLLSISVGFYAIGFIFLKIYVGKIAA